MQHFIDIFGRFCVSTLHWLSAVWRKFKQRHLLDIGCTATNLHADSVVYLQKMENLHNKALLCYLELKRALLKWLTQRSALDKGMRWCVQFQFLVSDSLLLFFQCLRSVIKQTTSCVKHTYTVLYTDDAFVCILNSVPGSYVSGAPSVSVYYVHK